VPKSLKTNECVYTKVFRRIVQQLENDTTFRRVVGPNLRSWKGVPADKTPFEPNGDSPVVRLTPQPRNGDWYSPDAQKSHLLVIVELAISSLCIDDVNDLYDVIVNALRAGALNSTGGLFANDLVALGAETGEILFDDPAFDPKPEAKPEGQFFALGQFQLSVIRSQFP
jgi:hypothetical protein